MSLFLYFCYWCSRDIKANTLLSFEKDHFLHFGINSLIQLLFKFFLNGEIQEKNSNLKNGFPDTGPDSNSKEAASEENSESMNDMEQKRRSFL